MPLSPSARSGEATPEVLQRIESIVNSHSNYRCVECADQIEAYLRQQNVNGRRIELDTPKPRTRYDDFIYDDSLPSGSDAIATNGHHEGIAIMVDGEERVFDNHHPNGVPTEEWKNNLTFDSKLYFRANFQESGYSF